MKQLCTTAHIESVIHLSDALSYFDNQESNSRTLIIKKGTLQSSANSLLRFEYSSSTTTLCINAKNSLAADKTDRATHGAKVRNKN